MQIESGYFYHIYNRGNNGQKIFFERENYLFFLRKMKKYISAYASIVAWCLMPNHFHWVVYVHRTAIDIKRQQNAEASPKKSHALTKVQGMTKARETHTLTSSEGMNKFRTLNDSIGILLRSYTRAIQKQEKLTGSLFQKKTKAKVLIDEIKIEPAYWNTAFGTLINMPEGKSYLETCIEYVHQNPVYSGLVKKADEWEFSSFNDYLGLRKGKLIDYELLKKERLLPSNFVKGSSHALTKVQGMTENRVTHTLTSSEGMSVNTAVIGIGSNINAEINISKMLKILGSEVEILKVSSLLKTKPIGIKNQPDFTNGAVKIKTRLSREELNRLLKNIEDQLGRDRSAPKFGPRTIDLDIVVWNGKIVDEDYYTRDFLQKSVQEIS